MRYHVLTLFPEMIEAALSTSVTGRGLSRGSLSLDCVNIRDYAEEKRKSRVDDYPYGGGAGMVMEPEPVFRAYEEVLRHIREDAAQADRPVSPEESTEKTYGIKPSEKGRPRVLYMSPQGRTFDQKLAEELSHEEDIIFLCGHYEGIDERVLTEIVTDEVSVGDYVLTGGELPALVIMDAVSRLVPGVLNNDDSAQTESFMGDGLLEYPQYTRPEVWHGRKVPSVLLSGDHKKVGRWRRRQSLLRTVKKRPDLCGGAVLDKQDRIFLRERGLQEHFPQMKGVVDSVRKPRRRRNDVIRNIVFDVGYVLLDYTWNRQFQDFGYDEAGVKTLSEKIFGHEWGEDMWHKYDLGLVSDEECLEYYLTKYPEDREALRWFFGSPRAWVRYPGTFTELMSGLKEKGYKIFLLSNYPKMLFEEHVCETDWYDYADGQAVSCYEHIGKPEEAFFNILLDRYGLRAEECLFLDDLKSNTDGAKALGLRTMTLDTDEARHTAAEYLKNLPKLR